MAAIIGKYVLQHVRKDLTQSMMTFGALAGATVGIIKAWYSVDTYSGDGDIPAHVAIGAFVRYPIQYGIVGACAGVVYPVTFIIPVVYHIWYTYRNKKTVW
jgi:hypothetical protein